MIGAIIAMGVALEAQRRAEEAEEEARKARKEAARKREEEDQMCHTGNAQGYDVGAGMAYKLGICRMCGVEAGIACRIGEI